MITDTPPNTDAKNQSIWKVVFQHFHVSWRDGNGIQVLPSGHKIEARPEGLTWSCQKCGWDAKPTTNMGDD